MIPVTLVRWSTWKKDHQDSVVLDPKFNEFNAFGFNPFQMGPHIIGVVLGDRSKAYPYKAITEQVVVNDFIGELPVVVYTSPEDEEISVFVRKIDELVLDFEWIGGKLADKQTGTVWDPITGFGVSGELKGELLKELPYSTAYDWAWNLSIQIRKFTKVEEILLASQLKNPKE